MKGDRTWIKVFSLIAFMIPATLCAQGMASLNGTITDPSGAVVPSATVKVINQSTGLSRTVTSNTGGYYVAPQLQPSTYSLEVNAKGFRTFVQKGITLLADQSTTANVVLRLGAAKQEVTVSGEPSQINVTTGTPGQVIEQRRMVSLPLNGRNAADLALLVPGVINAPSAGADQGNQKTFPGAVTFSTNGARQNEVSYNLDGSSYMDTYTNVNQPFPFPDALQEFSVQTTNYSSRYGEDQGGVVNIITKSGTNKYHGDAFEFVRNAAFNARNFFEAQRDQLKRNQFGGTIGGPIHIGPSWLKNKTWFFGGLQLTTIRNVGGGHSAVVPTPANLNGDFSALLDPNNPANPTGTQIVINDPLTGQPFPGNIIPTSRFDSASLNVVKTLPINQAGPNGQVFYVVPGTHQNFYDSVVKIDHSLTPRDVLVGRYDYDRFSNRAFFDPTNLLTYGDGSTIVSQNGLVKWTHTIAANKLNDFRVSYSRVGSTRGPASNAPTLKDFGVNILVPPIPGFQSIDVSGFFSSGNNTQGFFARNVYQMGDDLSWIHGRHNLSFGVSAARSRVNIDNTFYEAGGVSFTSDVTNYALASFLLGKLRTFRQSNGDIENKRETNLGMYVEDNFHASRRLTLNLGVRYEPFWPIGFPKGDFSVFRPNDYYAGNYSTQFINAPAGLFFPGDTGVPTNGTTGDFGNFAPRFGFAYDVFGNGKTSLRGGAGMFYASRVNTIDINRMEFLTPFDTQVTLTDPTGPFSNPLEGGIPSPLLSPRPPTRDAAFLPPVLSVGYQPNTAFIVPVSYSWNLQIERQLAPNWMLSVGYVGSHTSHMEESININPAVYIPGSALTTDQRRAFQGYSDIIYDGQDINSNYNSLQIGLRKRFGARLPLTLMTSYTYSKSLDTEPVGGAATQVGAESSSTIPWNMPGRHQFDYGPSQFDRTHNLVVSYVWELPKLASAPIAAREVFGNWELTGILTAESGDGFTVLAGKDQSQTGLGRDRAEQVGAPLGPGACANVAPCVNYLNRNSFILPAIGTFGNVGKASIRGPNYVNWDMGFMKNIPLKGDRVRLQLRGEFFNTFNRVNLHDPNSTVSSGSFGRILGANDPRIGQLALKLFF